MAGLVVAGLTTWQYEGTTAKKKHEHRISYLTGGGLPSCRIHAALTGLCATWAGRGHEQRKNGEVQSGWPVLRVLRPKSSLRRPVSGERRARSRPGRWSRGRNDSVCSASIAPTCQSSAPGARPCPP